MIRSAKSQNARGPKSSRRTIFIGCCNCFAGGVFFSVCLLDLLPAVRDKMTDALHEVNVYTKYPLGESIAAIGFILMVLSEILVHSIGKGSWMMDHMHDHDDGDSEEQPLMNSQKDCSYGSQKHRNATSSKSLKIVGTVSVENAQDDVPNSIEQDFQPHTPTFEDRENPTFDVEIVPCIHRSKSLRSISSVNTVMHSSFRMYVLIIALSLHSLFEGLSVGLITDVDTLIQLLVALLLHKSIISFALGVKLVDGGLKGRFIVKGIILFAAMAPLGVGLGLAVLTSFSRVASLFCSGILQGLATGSFLYVTFFEILPEEFTIQSHHKGPKVVSVTFGFLIIAGMCYYENRFHREMKKVVPGSETHHTLSTTVSSLL